MRDADMDRNRMAADDAFEGAQLCAEGLHRIAEALGAYHPTVDSISHRVFKDYDSGPYFWCPPGMEYCQFGSIVEGSEACATPVSFSWDDIADMDDITLEATLDEVLTAISDEAGELWDQANREGS